MANEIQVRASLTVRKGNLDERTTPQVFNATMDGDKGPSPGAITVGVNLTLIDFSQLATPGWCWIMNLDPTNFVEWGLWDSFQNQFGVIGEILPGEFSVFRLSRYLGKEQIPGTGTTPTGNLTRFAMKATVAPCDVLIKAFEK